VAVDKASVDADFNMVDDFDEAADLAEDAALTQDVLKTTKSENRKNRRRSIKMRGKERERSLLGCQSKQHKVV
jgi:hypothetical protein